MNYPTLNPLAVWKGPPSGGTIAWIMRNTHADERGRRYYAIEGSWRRLLSPESYADFNRRLDADRGIQRTCGGRAYDA